MRLKFLLVICCLALSYGGRAQEIPPAAQKQYNLAMDYKAKNKTDEACARMEKAIEEYPAFSDAYALLGEWYYEMHNFRQSVKIFREASIRCKGGNRAFAKPLTRAYLASDDPDDALLVIQMFAPSHNNDEWQRMRRQATLMKMDHRKMVTEKAYNMGGRLNTSVSELFPYVAPDTSAIYFTRRVSNEDEDFYKATPDSCGGWFGAINLGTPLNSPDQESAQVISADGHYMFITRCENRSSNGWDQGGCDLFMAYRQGKDSAWTIPQNFGATINTTDYEGMPSISPDNRQLYFVSNRPGGCGGYDIWVSHFDEGLWRPPVNLGCKINTPGNETSPFIHPDNRTLYFSSDGHTGLGGADLFMVKKINDSTWTEPLNLGYPINSTADERSINVTQNGEKIYFGSDRDSLSARFDMYVMTLPESLRPDPISTATGIVYDSFSKEPLNYAAITLRGSGKEVYEFRSNRGNGSFAMVMPAGKYLRHTERMGYREVDDTLNYTGENLQAPFVKNIPMLPSDYVAPIKDTMIARLHFRINDASLSDSDRYAIQKAFQPWADEKGIVVYVNAYTDNTGTPIINEQISFSRVNLVVNEIVNMGIDPVNIKAQGWGEANNLVPNDTEEGRNMNRRVEIIIKR